MHPAASIGTHVFQGSSAASLTCLGVWLVAGGGVVVGGGAGGGGGGEVCSELSAGMD